MGWEDILKTTDFQMFLVDVFDIPRSEAKNIQVSRGLQRALSHGGFLDKIEEKDFTVLAVFAEAKEYEKLVNYLQELFNKTFQERRNERARKRNKRPDAHYKQPEYRAKKRIYDKEYRSRQEVKERRNQRHRENYANNSEYRQKHLAKKKEYYRRKKERD